MTIKIKVTNTNGVLFADPNQVPQRTTSSIKVVNKDGVILTSPVNVPTLQAQSVAALDNYSTTVQMLGNDATTYANAVSYVDGKSYSNSSQVIANAAAAYANAVSYANAAAITAYSNAVGYANAVAGNAYSNAIAYSANASNINTGTLAYALLGPNVVNTTGSFTFTGNQTFSNSVTFNSAIIVNNSVGSAGQVLTSNGSGAYWTTATAQAVINVDAQYTWTNTQSFTNTITFSQTILGTANNANNLNGQPASYYTNATNITSGILPVAQLPANLVFWSNTNTYTALQTYQANLHAGNSTVNTQISNSGVLVSNSTYQALLGPDTIKFNGVAAGIGFYNSYTNYYISMRANNAGGAGQLDTVSDYNMYFNMGGAGGTPAVIARGFVFRSSAAGGVSGPVAQIDGYGNFYSVNSAYFTASVNAASYTVGSNFIANATTVAIGNTNVNVAITGSALTFNTNSTALATITKPTGNSTASIYLLFGRAGGNNAITPQWQGYHFGAPDTFANSSAGTVFPRVSHYYSYTTNNNPTDLYYNIQGLNTQGIPLGLKLYSYSGTTAAGIDIAGNGNIGIATTSPDTTLKVSGNANVTGNVIVGGALTSANLTASLFTGNVTGTASNATNLNSQPGSYYTNATNITTGTLPYAQLGTNVVNTTSSFTIAGVHTHNANIIANAASVLVQNATSISVINTNGIYVGNTTTNVVISNTISSFSGNVGIANSAPDATLKVTGTANVSGNMVIGGTITGAGNLNFTGTNNYFNSIVTVNSGLYRLTVNGPAYWMQQDGTGRNHWYWNTSGGGSPTFAYAAEDASALSLTVTNSGAGGSFFHRSASGVGKLAGDPITWTTTIYSDLNTFTWKGFAVAVANGATYSITANNSTNLNGQPGSYYTNATNITTGTLPWAQAPTNTVNTTGNFTMSGNLFFTGANIEFQSTPSTLGNTATNSANNFDLLTSVNNASRLRFYTYRFANGTSWTTASTRIQQRIDSTDQAYIEFNPQNYQYGVGLYGSAGQGITVSQFGPVSVTSTFISGNSSTNTQIFTNASIAFANATTTTTIGLTDIRVGNTTTNVVISNTTSSFGGNLSVSGVATVTGNVSANSFVGNGAYLTTVNATNITTGTVAEARLPYRMDQNVRTTDSVNFGAVTVSGNLTVNGSYVVLSGNSVTFTDNMLYLNQGISANITNVSGNGTYVVFTANNNYQVGWDVQVDSVNPSSYNGLYTNIYAANATTFTVANTNTAAYVSGGTARGKSSANPDLGFAAGYNDGTYRHTGLFRDHISGVWKVFDSYLPEPDSSVYIDQTNASFNVAKFQVSELRVGNNSVYATVNTTNFTGTANNTSYVGTIAAADVVSNAQLQGNLASYQTTAGLAANVALLAANSATYLGNSSGTIANVASWISGNASTTYSNSTTFASNASNITTGTLPDARLSSAVVNTSGSFTIAGVYTHNANVVANAASILVQNATSVSVINTNGIYVGNTTTNVIIANTTSSFGGNVSVTGALSAANLSASLFTGNVTGTASNATNLNSQPGSYYTNATNITTGTLPWGQAPSGTVNTSGNFTVAGNINFTAANIYYNTGLFVSTINATSNGVVINTTSISVGNSTVNVTVNTTSFSGTASNATNLNSQPGSYYTNATNITTGTLPYAQLGTNVVNTTSAFTITGVYTHNANIIANAATILVQNATTVSVINTNGIYVGNTTTNVVIANTTSSFGGNVSVTGAVNAANLSASLFTGNVTGTASNATNLNSQPGSYYTNATNITTGTLPDARLSSAVVNTSGNFTVAGNINFTAANIYYNTGLFVSTINATSNGIIVNTTTISIGNSSVNSTINSTNFSGTANNSTNLGGVSLSTLQSQITGNAATAYSNAVANAAALYQTTAGLSANVATLTANNANYLGTVAATSYVQNTDSRVLSGNINFTAANVYYSSGLFVSTINATSNGVAINTTSITIGNSTVNTTVNATTFSGTASNATNLNSQPGSYYTNATNITTGILPWAQAPANTINATGNFTVSGNINFTAANVYYNTGLFVSTISAGSNGVAVNATSITIGNSTVNTTIDSTSFSGTANNATNLGGTSLSTLQGQITGNAATAYSNAVANAAALYQTTAGLSANVATLTANNANYLGTVAAASYVQNTDSRVLSGNINFTAANVYYNTGLFVSTISAGSNGVAVNATSITIGNSTVNSTIDSTSFSGTASNATNLNSQPGSYYTNATNITTGTLPVAQLPANIVFWSNTNTFNALQTFQANLHTGSSTINTQISNSTILISNSTTTTVVGLTDIRVGNTTTNVVISNAVSSFGGNVSVAGVANITGNVTLGSSGFFVGNGTYLTTVNATNITTGTLPDARLSSAVVNTSGSFTIAGILTYNANIVANAASVLVQNATSVSVINTNGIYVGNTTTNVVIANTTSSFGGNVSVASSINLTQNATKLSFTPLAGGANVYFTQQNDDNFVFYSTNTSNQPRAIWSVFGNSITSSFNFNVPASVGNVSSTGSSYIANGFYVVPGNWGEVKTNITLNSANGNYQYWASNGAYTITAPTQDCAIDILLTNGSAAGSITFSGFTVGSATGSTYATTNGNRYILSVRRINSISTYNWYALQ